MTFAYNKTHVGDTLMVIIADGKGTESTVERKWDVARIKDEQDQVVAWNFFHTSDHLTIEENGRVNLTGEELTKLNRLTKETGFEEQFETDHEPKIVVRYIKTCVPHPDSGHLSITETEMGNGTVLQIVCGAPNIEAGQKVVVAKPGAMILDGMMIWPETLQGVTGYGMICSAHELHLPSASEKKGILVLPEDTVVGEIFLK